MTATTSAAAPSDWTQRNRDLAGLLARAGLGDRAAFAQLYERSSAHLFAVVLRINRDRAQAEDILQEVFVKVWLAARSFDPAQSQPLTWMTSIARHHAIDSLRRRNTQPSLQPLSGSDSADPGEETPEDPYGSVEDAAAGPLELLSQACEARAITACMQALNAQQRQCVALAFYNGLSHAEVAQQLRQPLGTVKSWVRRGLLALKNCLQGAAPRLTARLES
jgi:RNA polymerase sigma factor (sigma-70 family)